MKLVRLSYGLEVSTPTGDQCLTTNMIYKNCEIGERKLLGDLINLAVKRHDVILCNDPTSNREECPGHYITCRECPLT